MAVGAQGRSDSAGATAERQAGREAALPPSSPLRLHPSAAEHSFHSQFLLPPGDLQPSLSQMNQNTSLLMDCVLQSMRFYNTAAVLSPTKQMWEYLYGFLIQQIYFPDALD